MFEGYRTMIAAAIALLAEVLRRVGLEIDAAGVDGLVNSIVIIGSTLAAIVFKVKANEREADLKDQVGK